MKSKIIDGEEFLIQPASECTSAEEMRQFALKCHKEKVRGLVDETAKTDKPASKNRTALPQQ